MTTHRLRHRKRSSLKRLRRDIAESCFSYRQFAFESLEPRIVMATTTLDWDNLDSHRWVGESFGGDTNAVDWVAFSGRKTLRSRVTSANSNYTVIRTDAFLPEDWSNLVGLQADFYQVGGAANVDVKLEVRGKDFNPIIETMICQNIPHDSWTTCTWNFDTNRPGYEKISHLSLVFDGLASTQPTFYVDDLRLVTATGSEVWDDMDDGSRDWFYFGNWFDWGPTPKSGLAPVTHHGLNPTTPSGSLYLQWDADHGDYPDSNNAEIGTNKLEDLSDWSPYNRVTADVKVSDPNANLSLFFWDADTKTGFGTPTRKAGVADTWREMTWDVPWPSSFDNTDIDEVKFIVNGIDQYRTGTLFLDNIRLVKDTLPTDIDGLDYRFASFEREDDITDFSSNWGALGLPWDNANSHKWIGESFGGDTNAVDWVAFSGRKTLRSRVTSANSNYTVIRTDAFPAEDWRGKISLQADIYYQTNSSSDVDAKLEVRGLDFDPVIESILCNNLPQNAWQTCTWTFNTSLAGYNAVSHLSVVFEGLANTKPTFYVDNVKLLSAADGNREWDDMDDGSRHWFYSGNWFDWGPTREFGLEPVTHNGNNRTKPSGSLFLHWDHPHGVDPTLNTAEISTTKLNDIPDWGAYNRILADVKVSNPNAQISLFFWDDETATGFSTAKQRAPMANEWKTLSWALPWPRKFATTDIDEVKIVVHEIDRLAAGTLLVDNITLVPDIAVTQGTAVDGSRGSLEFNYSLPDDSFTGAFFSLWGNSDCRVGGPADRCSDLESINFNDIFGVSNEQKSFEQLSFWVRGSGLTQNVYNVKVELKDVRDRFENTAFRYITIDDSNPQWQQIVLDANVLNGDFWSYNQDPPDPTQMKFLVFVVESYFNAPTGMFYIDKVDFTDANDVPFDPSQNTDDAFLDLVSRRSFSYFLDWYEPTTGLFHDRSEFPDLMSIAATGFGLTALTIGEQRGWIDRQVAIDMIIRTLTTLRDGQRSTDTLQDAINQTNGYRGFFYHFLNVQGKRADAGSELSSVDTALLLLGAITAKQHFSDVPEIVALVDEINERVEWDWFLHAASNQFYLGWTPEPVKHRFELAAPGGGYFSSRTDRSQATWDYATDEVMLINILAIASPTHPVPTSVFYAWTRSTGRYAGQELVHSFNGSFFTYVFAHLWIDFQPLGQDHPPPGSTIAVDWWDNSVAATLASQQFAVAQADDQLCDGDGHYATYGAASFGLTAADGPDGKYHAYGALPTDPRANYDNPPEHDGTIAPYGAASAILFQPQTAINALKHYFTSTESWNYRLGFGDAFNLDTPDCSGPWYNHALFGIDNGPMLMAIENARSGFVWEMIGRNSAINWALERIFGNSDFGDAPDTYGTTLASSVANGGARHVTTGPQLGTLRDRDSDASLPLDGSGDDAVGADEDGVAMLATMLTTMASNTTASVAITASHDAMLDAWIDFNRNGVFEDPIEHIAGGTSIALAVGLNVLNFVVPAGATPGASFARFRISTLGDLLPTGPANDGEVEDYVVTILDGGAAGGVSARITLPVSGQLNVTAVGNEVVVKSGAIELFRSPGSSLASLKLFGAAGDDTLSLSNLNAIFRGPVGGIADGGNDIFRLTGTGQILDLTNIADADIQGLEVIDITGNGNNSLILNVSEVVNISPMTDTLRVQHDQGDTVNYGAGWTVEIPQIVAGQFLHVLTQSVGQAIATIQVVNTIPFQNPFLALDTDYDGMIAPLDALIIINRLNSTGPEALTTPTSLTGVTKFYYVDINGDQSIAPIDALLIINFLNGRNGETESPPDVETPLPTLIFTSHVNPQLSSLIWDPTQKTKLTESVASRSATQQSALINTGRSVLNSTRKTTPMQSRDVEYAQSLDELLREDFLFLLDAFFNSIDAVVPTAASY